jgi:hypothetical protein
LKLPFFFTEVSKAFIVEILRQWLYEIFFSTVSIDCQKVNWVAAFIEFNIISTKKTDGILSMDWDLQ